MTLIIDYRECCFWHLDHFAIALSFRNSPSTNPYGAPTATSQSLGFIFLALPECNHT